MADFVSSRGLTVTPPTGDGGVYTIVGPDAGGDPATFTLDTLRDECSCAAIQGIACDHKAAVDEYVAATVQTELETPTAPGSEPEPKVDLSTEHRPTYKRRQVGTTETKPARPLWAQDVDCSCGWKSVAEGPRTKDEAREVWKGHREERQGLPLLHSNREEWLQAGRKLWEERFRMFGIEPEPNVRVGVGFTYGRGARIGECWRKEASGDQTWEVIVHNKLDDPVEVFRVEGHELLHTVMPAGEGHGKLFARAAKSVGFTGPMRTTPPSEELVEWMKAQVETLGRYPHASLDSARRIREGGPKKQTNRWLKYVCEHPGCGWIVRAPKAGFRGVCIAELHQDTPAMMVPAFVTETEPEAPGPEEEV